jgi:hypothetical protein
VFLYTCFFLLVSVALGMPPTYTAVFLWVVVNRVNERHRVATEGSSRFDNSKGRRDAS